jgi:hypothetical protein
MKKSALRKNRAIDPNRSTKIDSYRSRSTKIVRDRLIDLQRRIGKIGVPRVLAYRSIGKIGLLDQLIDARIDPADCDIDPCRSPDTSVDRSL